MLAGHGDFEKGVLVARIERLWQSRRFVAEYESVSFFKSAGIERFLSVRREEKQPFGRSGGKVVFPSVVERHVEMGPIVEAGACDRAVVERETEGFDEMERRAQADAESADCAGIVRDFRPQEDDGKVLGHEGILPNRSAV